MDVPLLHRSIWIIASIGITAVSQPFTYGFVKDTYELLTSPSLHSKMSPEQLEAEDRVRETSQRVAGKKAD
jgi:hypothetical protein